MSGPGAPNTSGPITPPAGGPAPTAAAGRFWSSLSQGEQLIVIGAALILVIGEWLLASLVGGPAFLVSTPIAAAQLLLFAYVRHAGRPMSWPIPYAVVLASLASVIAVPAVSGFLDTLRHASELGSLPAADVLGLLTEWAGAVLVALGAFLVWKAEPR